jgi:hypothetical protein
MTGEAAEWALIRLNLGSKALQLEITGCVYRDPPDII